MAQMDTTARQYLHCCVPYFSMHGKDSFWKVFFSTWKDIVKSGEISGWIDEDHFKFEAPILQAQLIAHIL